MRVRLSHPPRPPTRSPLRYALSRQGALWAGAIALTVLKLWLVSAQPLTAAANATYDDRLFVNLADSILHGRWLGAYDHLTLAKGPAYSVFIALVHRLHVPLPLAQQLLYVLACAALTLAVAPAFRLRVLPFAIYAVLLFNPMSFEAPVMARVLRQHLATPAAMLVIAGFAGLWFHARAHYYVRLLWSAAAGAGLAASWLSREEASLLLPAALLLAAGAALAHRRSWGRAPTWILLAVPWLTVAGATAVVAALNHHYYRAWVTVEFRAAEFADAYAALVRVRPHEWQPYVPVAREVRERIYPVSPAFASLRDYFEGDQGRNWAALGTSLTGRPREDREIAGGWFVWALRDAVHAAGDCPDAGSALRFYRRLADEVNAACDDGRLDSRPRRSGFLSPWDESYRGPLLAAFQRGAVFLTRFDQFYARPGPSTGDEQGLELFRAITRARLSPTEGNPPAYTATQRAQLRVLEGIGRGYQAAHPFLLWAAFAGTLLLAAWPGRDERRPLLALQAALAGTVILTLAAIALIHVSSFPALITGYFHGSYPLMLGFTAAGLAGAIDFLWRRFAPAPANGAS
jgi:hypothetical protein